MCYLYLMVEEIILLYIKVFFVGGVGKFWVGLECRVYRFFVLNV